MKTVFISHSGTDSERAENIARLLQDAKINVRFDRKELAPGESFLSFMENSLLTSDYCLLLWSKDASGKNWVRLEWEAALYKSVQESRSFIVVGRLEPYPVPSLLGPRLIVELYPEYDSGVGQLISLWTNDLKAESDTLKPVAKTECFKKVENGLDTMYITSVLFDKTVPVKLNFGEPVVVIIDRIIDSLSLPRDVNYNNLIGLHFEYNLAYHDITLDKNLSLSNQGVQPMEVVWLETRTIQYSHILPVNSEGGIKKYRSFKSSNLDNINNYSQALLLDIIRKNKLRF